MHHIGYASICIKCHESKKLIDEKKRNARDNLKLDRILQNGYSCEVCQVLVLKPDSKDSVIVKRVKTAHGFITIDGVTSRAREFVEANKELLEIRVLEWNHLSKVDFESRYPGQQYVPKKKGGLGSGRFVNQLETTKCELICTLCHTKATIKDRGDVQRYRRNKRQKKALVEDEKRKIGKCQLCECWYPDCLPYFEFDHVDTNSKVAAICDMVILRRYNANDVRRELLICRLLCRDCHRLHTNMQYDNGTIVDIRIVKKKARLDSTHPN